MGFEDPWHQILPELQFQGHHITNILHPPAILCRKSFCARVVDVANADVAEVGGSWSLTFVKLVHNRHELFHVGFCSVYIYIIMYIHHYSSLFIIIHLYSYTCTCICNPEDMAGRCPFASVIPFKDLQPFVAAVQKTLRSYEVIFHDIFCEIPTWVTTYRSSTLR